MFETPKIVYPDIYIYLHQSFAWDTKQHYPANTCYFIPTTDRYLTALLNSSAVEGFYKQIAARIQGGYLRAFSDRMQAVPIPKTEPAQPDGGIDDGSRGCGTRRPDYERLLNGLIYELFFPEVLHTQNIRLIENTAPASDCASFIKKISL